MWRRIAKSVGGLVLALIVLWVVFTVAMRTKFPSVLTAIRRINRAVLNPRTMEKAGHPGAYASVIRHLGRATGTPYQTPVQALATDDGFLVPLPYGSTADWLKNVLAAGSAVIIHQGNTYPVDRPELVSSSVAAPNVPSKDRRSHRLYGVDHFLRVQRVEPS